MNGATYRVSCIIGTRPEAIKMAPLVLALRRHPRFACNVCVTGQHREMLDQVLDVFEIVPDEDLNLMRPGQSLAGLTSRAIEALDGYLQRTRPQLVLAQGDTTTVFCAALAAFYQRIPFGHVEAGLRTGNLQSPWPEEANRVLTSRLTTLHFAPTAGGRRNLLGEGVSETAIFVTGNTVIDALFLALQKTELNQPEIPGLRASVADPHNPRRVVLITGHRRENFGAGFESICNAIAELARRFPDVDFVYPVHRNPNVVAPVQRILGALNQRNVHLLDPLPYLPFVAMMKRASLIITDSGGVQEEAPSLGKPVLVMRDTTERPEAVAAGTVKLVGTDEPTIVAEAARLLEDREACNVMARAQNPYGDGKATPRILAACEEFLGKGTPDRKGS